MKRTSGVWVCVVFAFLCFLEPAHVLPVCMINLFSLIIYVIQNVIYVSVNFELWPIRWIVNLSPQTLSEYTLLHSLVWSTHKSLQTGAEVHTLSFFPTLSLTEVGDFRLDKTTAERPADFCERACESNRKNWSTLGRANFDSLLWIIKNFCRRYIKKHLDFSNSRKAFSL